MEEPETEESPAPDAPAPGDAENEGVLAPSDLDLPTAGAPPVDAPTAEEPTADVAAADAAAVDAAAVDAAAVDAAAVDAATPEAATPEAAAVELPVTGGPWWPGLLGVGIYCVLAVIVCGAGTTFSNGAMPTVASGDSLQELWFLAWPAHAITHGLNPLHSDYAAYPRGLNMMSSTSMPLLGLLATPITLTLGPVATFNLLVRLAFASSASSLFLVARRWVKWWPAAFVAGLLYGFSPYMLNEGFTHLFLVFLPLPPVLLALVDTLVVRQNRNPWRTGILLGVVAAAQFLISAEVLAFVGILLATMVVLLAVRHPVAAKQRAMFVVKGLSAAAATFVVLAGYAVWTYVAGPQHVKGLQHPKLTYYQFYDDLYGLVAPTTTQRFGLHGWVAKGDSLVQGNLVEHSNYLGVPLLVILAVFIGRLWRVGVVALATLVGGLAIVFTLGPRLYVNGAPHLTGLRLPYDVLYHLPFVDGLLAPRFFAYAYLAAGLVLAIGLDRVRSGGWRMGAPRPAGDPRLRIAACCAVVVVGLLPLWPRSTYQAAPTPVPSFFTTPADVDRIPAGSVVLPYPDAQLPTVEKAVFPEVRAMAWQAVSGMRFKMIGAYAAQPDPRVGGLGQGANLFDAPAAVQQLFGWALYGPDATAAPPPATETEAALRTFSIEYDVSTIVVDPSVGVDPSTVVADVTAALGKGPVVVGGVDAWFGVAAQLRAG